MKKIQTLITSAVLLSAGSAVHAQGLLMGDQKLACEAMMCLTSGSPPHECQESLNRFFSINFKKPAQTISERMRFLNQCPIQMPAAAGSSSSQDGGSGNNNSSSSPFGQR